MYETVKKKLKSCALFMLMIGLDLRKLLLLVNYKTYSNNYNEFIRLGGKVTHKHVILNNFTDQAGTASGHYFHQDLLVANLLFIRKPERHIDIGSRIDGFVAHVAAFRVIEVIDIRDLKDAGHKNLIFTKMDLMDEKKCEKEITDSLSCLHVIEHFGLGRYGDSIDPLGHKKGFNNLLKLLKPKGTLYISFPIGTRNEVHFNAHRVFHPLDIFAWVENKESISLERFDYVDDFGVLHQNFDIANNRVDVTHGCGIYSFIKLC